MLWNSCRWSLISWQFVIFPAWKSMLGGRLISWVCRFNSRQGKMRLFSHYSILKYFFLPHGALNFYSCLHDFSKTERITVCGQVKKSKTSKLSVSTPWRYMGSWSIASLNLNLDTMWMWVANITPQLLYTPGKDTAPIEQELGGPRSRCERFVKRQKFIFPAGSELRNVHPLA